jgi:hypothetical protein
VSAEDISSTSLHSVLSVLRGAGAVVIRSSATTSTEQGVALADVAGESLIEIPAAEKDEDIEQSLKRALGIAEKLRLSDGETGKGKADTDAFTD